MVMDVEVDFSPNGAHRGRQLCVVSCQGNGVAYYWSVIGGHVRDAVSFRGFSATFPAPAVARVVVDFTVQGPLIDSLADLQDVTQVQAIQMGGSLGTPSPAAKQVPFDVKILAAARSRRP
jgi:hypothetical protein